MSPYLSFKGDCEEAFAFYERCLGAEPGPINRYGGSPMADQGLPIGPKGLCTGALSLEVKL